MEKNTVIRIAIIGAESTGKTRLCEDLAQHYKTTWVPEYAREYFDNSTIYNYTEHDLELIAKKQLQREAELQKKAQRVLFCDTTLITLKIWAELEFEATPLFIEEQLQKITYDHYLITANDVDWVQDELRQNKFDRDMILQMNVNEVIKLKGKYSLIAGKEETRLKVAKQIVDRIIET